MSNQYQQYSTVKKYWHLMRPHTLTASVVPVLVGTAASKIYFLGSEDHIKISLFIAMLLACLLIQAATNMFNEYYDYKKGLDDHESVGIGGAIVRNGMSPELVLRLAIAFYILAAILGLFLAANSSFWLLPVGLVCMAVGYLYTGALSLFHGRLSVNYSQAYLWVCLLSLLHSLFKLAIFKVM
ncbi:1,4-dihydroxy-2-naphthoate polyprenyltransferase [Staphylococcus aureus]|nr:1,4-dihydroxy-2-naphthoate polyprenyltransferase [Staphylococcus aureus]